MAIRTEVLMGTTVTIEAAASDAVLDRAFGWFEVIEQTCTRFDPASELSQLTMRPGEAVPVSTLLFEVVRFALHIADASGGAFDPTVGAVMQRRGFNREHRTGAIVPDLPQTRVAVTYRDVAIDAAQQTITLRQPLLLDLGAVAKGMAIDLAARELASCVNFAIDAGGDLYLGGVNNTGEPWSIGIRDPRTPGTFVSAVRVSNQAVCTSGDYERRGTGPAEGGGSGGSAQAGRDVTGSARAGRDEEHHIVDPRTGMSPNGVASVTVIAPSAMVADALATAAFVLGPDDGLALLEQMDVHGLIVTADLHRLQTSGWPGE